MAMNRNELTAKVRRAVSDVLRRQGYVAAVDVLMELGYLDKARYEDWRRGRVPSLERVIHAGLGKVNVVLRTMASCCRECGLKESWTDYRKWGKGPKLPLRFSKSGEPALERAYATHYVSRRLRKAKELREQEAHEAPLPPEALDDLPF